MDPSSKQVITSKYTVWTSIADKLAHQFYKYRYRITHSCEDR